MQISVGIDLFINTNAGFRGTSFCFKSFMNYTGFEPVNYCSVRQWILRLGYGLLNMPVEKRDDWVYIIDFSIQLGQERCLLILGTNYKSLQETGYQLAHGQMQVLDICVQKKFTGEDVFKQLGSVSSKTGLPAQIISDKGNDVSKGIELFCGQNPETIHTYDITHIIGIILKKYLGKDRRWLDLQDDLGKLAQQVKQSDVAFLRPIAMSKKARWLNIGRLIQWLENMYGYKQKADFGLIEQGYKIKNKGSVFKVLETKCKNKYEVIRLKKVLEQRIFKDRAEAQEYLSSEGYGQTFELTDAGKLRFEEKFSILDKHYEFFKELQQLNIILNKIKSTIKCKGISSFTLQEIENIHISYPLGKQIYFDIMEYLKAEHSKPFKIKSPLLACSDVIESIFGKFKCKINQTVGGIYESVLIIALYCSDLSSEKIIEILTKYRMKDVKDGFRSKLGLSNLAKRRLAFNAT